LNNQRSIETATVEKVFSIRWGKNLYIALFVPLLDDTFPPVSPTPGLRLGYSLRQ